MGTSQFNTAICRSSVCSSKAADGVSRWIAVAGYLDVGCVSFNGKARARTNKPASISIAIALDRRNGATLIRARTASTTTTTAHGSRQHWNGVFYQDGSWRSSDYTGNGQVYDPQTSTNIPEQHKKGYSPDAKNHFQASSETDYSCVHWANSRPLT